MRWFSLFPAYVVGLGLGPAILILSFTWLRLDVFQHTITFFTLGSALASIGSSFLPAWVAPSNKFIVGVLGAVLTAIAGPILFLTDRGEFDAPQAPVFFGYIGGALLAIVILSVLMRHSPVVAHQH